MCTWDQIRIADQNCFLFQNGTACPVFIWPFFPHAGNELEKMSEALSSIRKDYILAAFQVNDWNADLSPWKARSAFGSDDFEGKGKETLSWIQSSFLPFIRNQFPDSDTFYIMGYSLAGLFSLWTLYECSDFSGAVCASSSLWIDGWDSYMDSHNLMVPSSVYLSLGGKEEKTRNPIMSKVGDRTRTQEILLKNDPNIRSYTLEWNPGGHFADSVGRLTKGINWILNHHHI